MLKRLPLVLLALTPLLSSAVSAQTPSYVLIPTVVPGRTETKVELLRSDFSISDVRATYIAEGTSGLKATPTHLQAYIGPSTSRANPLLSLTPIAPSGGMVILEPEQGLSTVEVSFELEQNPIRTAWKLPLLSATDFFAPGSTIYVLNLVKTADAASTLQLFNVGGADATCSVQVLRPKGSVIEQRTGIKVPAVGVVRIADILRNSGVSSGLNAAVSCDLPFYALGNYPATDRWNSRVEYPVTQLPGATTSVTLENRSGTFLNVTQANSDLVIPLTLDTGVAYHSMSIDFDVAVVDPSDFVVFRNVIGMFRQGGRRFGKTLFFGSFENFDKSKYVVDVGTPFIETTLKRNFPLIGGHHYHVAITLNNDQQSLHYVITNPNGSSVMDLLGGLYNSFNVVNGKSPIIQFGLDGVADNAYFPPFGWRFSNLKIVAVK